MKGLKIIFYIITFLLSFNKYGQLSKFKGSWITKSHEAIIIDDTASNENAILSNAKLYDIEGDVASVSGNKLSLVTTYWDNKGEHNDNYEFEIISHTEYILFLKPSSLFSRKFFGNQRIMKFVRQELTVDSSIVFEKIIYHTTMCLGTCPTYHLEIDSNKRARFHAEQVFKREFEEDTAKQGYFIGILSDHYYGQLLAAIQTCNLKALISPDLMALDAPTSTIIIYFNGQRKVVYTSMPPAILNRLIQTLYNICEKNNLPKTNEIFKLEELIPSFVIHPVR
jgi:hypothetical protein